MALSEYMPYGAPELLDGERSRMLRSTLAASLAVVMLASGLGAVMQSGERTITLEPPTPWHDELLPPLTDPPRDFRVPPPVEPAPPRAQDAGIPVPVPDRVAPDEVQDAPSLPGVPRTDGTGDTPRPDARGPLQPPPDKDPEPGAFVAVDELPYPIHCAEARYPDLAREAGVEGTVRVLMLVGLAGRVERAIIAPGGSVLMLDEAALDASRQCVFTPALMHNRPVKVWVSRNYHFSLH
jgi:protein TonB